MEAKRPTNFDTFKPKARQPEPDPAAERAAAKSASQLGFSPRETPIDGRSLRATGSTKQLNLKITPELHARFVLAGQGYPNLGKFLEHLMDQHEKER